MLVALAAAAVLQETRAGDILRGGATASGAGRKNAEARQSAGAEAAAIAKTKAADRLSRTTQAVNAMRQMQEAARNAAGDGGVPDGLVAGGLKMATGARARWVGASLPTQSGSDVTITQTQSQALLHWETFNVGKNTTLNFDQKAGGNDAGKWIAFNKVFDPSGVPSQIRGKIRADGQVYIINQNGIIFGAGSQVNARALVASALPINDNLVSQGLLNNKDAQFLFSAFSVPGGSDGTPGYTPPSPPAGGRYGDVVVERGATLSGPVSADGNGGRVMLVGANVRNDGTISTPSGQTILAAGLQVGVMAHDSADPSLRGLDAWVGEVGSYAGRVENSGIVEAYTGSVLMTGREVNQSGVIDSSTSVKLNGRIDLKASYGAVANPNFDNQDKTGGGGPAFLNQLTGTVTLGSGSVTRILPDYASTATVPGSSLPENSQINLEGLAISMQESSVLLAPHADVTFRAGRWAYADADSNRTIFKADGTTVEDGLVSNFSGTSQKFLYSGGQVYLGAGSILDVSGSTDVFVALSQSIQTVQLRGTELADQPSQRDSPLRGKSIVVDLRDSGEFEGSYWVGTPLGDLTSLTGVIERNVAQLTADGGTVTMQAGGSIVLQPGSTVDVSGGFYRNEGGRVRTSRVMRNGNLIDIADATPDMTYDGIYDGRTVAASNKWGISKTFGNALAPMGAYTEKEYISGARGGAINLTAPTIAAGGNLVGQTITGPRQLDSAPEQSSLSFTFQAEERFAFAANDIRFYKTSPTPPAIRVTQAGPRASAAPAADGQNPAPGAQFDISSSWWSSEGGGFGHVMVDNRDGDLLLPSDVHLRIPAGGSFSARAANIDIAGSITAPGGTVDFTAYNFSPYEYQRREKQNLLVNEPAPDAVAGRGVITLGPGARIDVAGLMVDDRPTSANIVTTPRVLDGGKVSMEAFTINLAEGSSIDVSGGVLAEPVKGFRYGDGGSISLLAGRDPDLSTSTGGTLKLGGTLAGYSANKGGSLAIRAGAIQIGGQSSDPSILVLAPQFFRTGGFTSYSLTGIGKSTGRTMTAAEKKAAVANPAAAPVRTGDETYVPAIRIVENTLIEPVAEQLRVRSIAAGRGGLKADPVLQSEGERHPVSIKLAASGADDPYTADFLEARGDIVMERGSAIRTDAGASVLIGTDENLTKTLADTVSIEGTIEAPGGTVAIFTRGEFRAAPDIKAQRGYALPTVYLGPQSRISTAGKFVSTPDPFGRRTGVLYDGGTISIHGNIVAERGAVLDVSGSSAVVDLHPSQAGEAGAVRVPATSGLTSLPYSRQTVPARIDSNGGRIELRGSQMLFTDATLAGRPGGPSATGGTLSIFSGRFYAPGSSRTSADINLVVSQSGLSLPQGAGARGVGLRVKDPAGTDLPAMGYFAADTFLKGGFASLDLGYDFLEDASPIAYGGNVQFLGDVSISAPGYLRLAGGGIIRAEGSVNLAAKYIAVGQLPREPVHPNDAAFVAFRQDPFSPVDGEVYRPVPTFGSGAVSFSADLIDIGTTVFEKTGRVAFTAADGDIRGDGTLSVAGEITLTAGQIYPATLADFNIFAYDHAVGKGSVTIRGSGVRPMPYSAGGSINIFASSITQGGVLRAPFGSITLGWDGTDFDRSTAAFDSPTNPVVGSKLAVPAAQSVTLLSGSSTSVSSLDPSTGKGLSIPFGLSTDGLSWYDPRGVNVTANGLPQKRVSIAGDSVTMEYGSVIDLRGGGDLLAYRWVPGTGGSRDLLGGATGEWGEGASYEAGDLVTYKGKTWSARRSIDPEDFSNSAPAGARKRYASAADLTANLDSQSPEPPAPGNGFYWTEVKESYAIVPGYTAAYAPRLTFNTGSNAEALGGDRGYVSSMLGLGDQIQLKGVEGLDDGSYTLLPRRFAILPGAFLVTPTSLGAANSFSTASGALKTSGYRVSGTSSAVLPGRSSPDGATFAGGFRSNSMNAAGAPAIRTTFEIAPPDVVAGRAEYEVYGANDFMVSAASRLDLPAVQRLPIDAGFLSFHGNSALQLEGSVLSGFPAGGRGARVDVSSDADMTVVGGAGGAAPGARVVLKSSILNSWGAESLLLGGLRRETEEGTVVDVRTSRLTVNNSGEELASPEITLVSKSGLTIAAGARVSSSGRMSEPSVPLTIIGDGALLRLSADANTSTARTGLAGSISPLMTIAAGATLSGPGMILDSTYGTSLSPAAALRASSLTLGSGQISIALGGAPATLSGSVVSPHLVLEGSLLDQVRAVSSLTLSSYRTIDIYGAGSFGSPSLASLRLLSSGLRGYNRGSVVMSAADVTLGNPAGSIVLPAAPGPLSGDLAINASTVTLGSNALSVTGYQSLLLNASNGVVAAGTGSLTLPGALTVSTPLIAASKGISYDVTATGAVALLPAAGGAGVSPGLGSSLSFTGASIDAATTLRLPSGSIALRATSGSVIVRGELDVSGSTQRFYDVVRHANAGGIQLTSESQNVVLLAGSRLNVSASAAGGDAGSLSIRAGSGSYVNNGLLLGSASPGSQGGLFSLDTGSIVSFANVNAPLEAGGFTAERNMRVRTGSVTIDGAARANSFSLSADAGSITLTGAARIDASGTAGGSIALAARDSVTVRSGALLTVAARTFASDGKGGSIRIEAGVASGGVANTAALLDLQSGSTIDLSVRDFVPGDYTTPGSSAFAGRFQGTLHLRAPRSGNDVRVDPIESRIIGASSVVVEAFRLYDRSATQTMDTTLRTAMNSDAVNFMNAGEAAIRTKLLTGNPSAAALSPLLVVAPGVEIFSTGDLALGLANPTGSTNAQALSSADWDLSSFRYGTRSAPGILTLRAAGNLVFNNTLSDGFNPVTASADNGHSTMWLATLKTIAPDLPANTQSWSYRLTAGADLSAADFRTVLPSNQLAAGKGSVFVGEFYPSVPNTDSTTSAAGIGSNGQTADTIRISTTTTNRGTRFEVIRTGTGDITVTAGRDVQLRNPFATIYTAGVALPTPTTIYQANDFVVPILNRTPSQVGSGITLGAYQQTYNPVWSMAGGDVSVSAGASIGRYTLVSGVLTVDSSRQTPTNWLYRRGYVDPTSGLFAADAGVDGATVATRVTDAASSTAWWIDYSNFFEGIGALGGGDVRLAAGGDIVNVDAVAPTNARMQGKNASGGNLSPADALMLELGGGDVSVRAGRNIDGGVYYVERGAGRLVAGGSILTNSARSPQLGRLDISNSEGGITYDSTTWLPTTLMAGKASFEVSALKDVLLGPITNPFLLPQGLNNRFWYKTYFTTFGSASGANVSSFGGGVTIRTASTLPEAATPTSILANWFSTQNLFIGDGSITNASYYQPWLRSTEVDMGDFGSINTLTAASLKASAFSGDVNLVGPLTLFPSPTGTLELVASGSIIGLQSSGGGKIADSGNPGQRKTVKVWTASSVNVSDADPSLFPGIRSPIGYQTFSGRSRLSSVMSESNPYSAVDRMLAETGSYTGQSSAIDIKRALHAQTLLHKGDASPVRLYAGAGSITGLTLFSPKFTRILADKDVTDVSFYIQHVSKDDVSVVSAGRDVILYNENAAVRSLATNEAKGNYVGDPARRTSAGQLSNALAGDIQINGPGYLEVFAGRDLDLGTGSNYTDGTGVGITSIGNFRNPFLPFEGASIIAMAGVKGKAGGAASGLASSNLDFQTISLEGASRAGGYATAELESIAKLRGFFQLLQQAGTESETTGSYETGYSAIESLFGRVSGSGQIYTRARDIRTATGGAVTLAAPSGGLTMASDIFGNPSTPPGIVTEYGGEVSIFTRGSVDIGRTRIFTLRGGDMTIWSSEGDIAAGTSPKTVVTAPPTRVVIDTTSADVATDLGGLATGGGIGVLASVEGVEPANVYLIAPKGTVDAGDAGIQATGNINIAAAAVLNADNISAGGSTSGVPSAPAVAAPNISGLTSGSSANAAASTAADSMTSQGNKPPQEVVETPSVIQVEVLGYGGGEDEG